MHLSFRFGNRFSIVIALFLVLIFDAVAQEKVIKTDVESYPPVTIKNAEIRTFYSEVLKREMNIYIKLPASYYDNTDAVYQALYFTDANRQLAEKAGLKKSESVSGSEQSNLFFLKSHTHTRTFFQYPYFLLKSRMPIM